MARDIINTDMIVKEEQIAPAVVIATAFILILFMLGITYQLLLFIGIL